MCVGDLVFCYGHKGLILKTNHSMHATEHYIYWFGYARDYSDRFCWVAERQLVRIA